LFANEQEHLSKLHKIVEETIKEEELIVNNLLNPPKEIISRGQAISDKVALFGGSWKFIIFFGVILTVWIIVNATLPEKDRFDPYPFILMNLVLSTIAALQAPIIMMSQNRQEEKDRIKSQFGTDIISVDFIDKFNDIDGLAALVNTCDFIITTSNVTAHIAGALGKKTFLLVPFNQGRIWYWHDSINKSLWYPSINIYRQTESGDWIAPIMEIKKDIEFNK
jgi:hypothetical protein